MSSAPVAFSDVADRVRDRLREERIDPAHERDRAQQVARAEIRRHNDRALARGSGVIEDEAQCVVQVLASVAGFGALEPYLADASIEEIWINAPDRIFAARDGLPMRLPLVLTEDEVRSIVERMLNSTGRRVDLSQPFVDASLPDGSRVHVVIPDVVRAHWTVNIRKFLSRFRDLEGLVEAGALPPSLAHNLTQAMTQGASVLVSGATHAGKTTMLSALIAAEPPAHRVITVEETFELAVDAVDVVAMQGRQPSLEGTGEIPLRRLVKEALRMRPDRLVVGEVRDAEALDLVLALNTGVPCAATIHANNAAEALDKLMSLTLLAGRNVDRDFVAPAIARSVDLVVHCERRADGSRRVAEVLAPGIGASGEPETQVLYRAERAA